MATKYTKQKNGYYQAKVWDGTYVDGRKHRINLRTKKSSKELERMIEEYNRNRENLKMVHKTDITFVDYAKQWISVYKGTKSGGTQENYMRVVDKTLKPLYGDLKLQDITPLHIQAPITQNAQYPRKCQLIAMTLRQIINSAVTHQYISPAHQQALFKDQELPKYTCRENRPLTDQETAAVMEADFSAREKAFIYLIYFTGIRRGEALAFTPFCFDFRRNLIHIGQAVAFNGNEPYIKDVKTANSIRDVPMASDLSEYMKTYVRQCNGYLFRCRGKDLMTKSAYNKMWGSILKKLNATGYSIGDDLTAHNFRHNFCTNLCYQIPTVSIKRIAQLLGDSERMVIEVYNHIKLEKEDAQGAIEAAFGKNPSEKRIKM